jgi:Glycosyl transferases group 1
MAAGTAIVASDIHGYKGVVRRDREALLVEPREPKQIAGAVAQLLRDDGLRAELGRNGLARAREFSWERVTAKVDEYYGVVIRRLAARDALPASFHAEIPPSPRVVPAGAAPAGEPKLAGIVRDDEPQAPAATPVGRT